MSVNGSNISPEIKRARKSRKNQIGFRFKLNKKRNRSKSDALPLPIPTIMTTIKEFLIFKCKCARTGAGNCVSAYFHDDQSKMIMWNDLSKTISACYQEIRLLNASEKRQFVLDKFRIAVVQANSTTKRLDMEYQLEDVSCGTKFKVCKNCFAKAYRCTAKLLERCSLIYKRKISSDMTTENRSFKESSVQDISFGEMRDIFAVNMPEFNAVTGKLVQV